MRVFRLYTLFSIGLALVALLVAPRACAQDMRGRLFMRVALGGGYGGIGSEAPDDGTNSVGYALVWDAAFGTFMHRAVALHASWFGFFLPNGKTTHDEHGYGRKRGWVQTLGAGFTLTPPRDFVHAPRLRPFLSASIGLALAEDHMLSSVVPAFGATLLGGFELRLNSGLRIGLALQGSYSGRRVSDGARPLDAGHAAGVLSFTYDTRRSAERAD